MIKYCDLDSKQEIWKVTTEDFHYECSPTPVIGNAPERNCPLSYNFIFDSKDIINIPEYIDVYDEESEEFDHVQYFPFELIQSFCYENIGWHQMELRHKAGKQKEYLIYNFEDWYRGYDYFIEFIKSSIGKVDFISLGTDPYKRRKRLYSKNGSYFAKTDMPIEERRKIFEKQKELFYEYVEQAFQDFKSFFISKIGHIELHEDKEAFKKKVLYSVESNILKDEFQFKNEDHIKSPPPIELTINSSFTVRQGNEDHDVPWPIDSKVQLYDRDCQSLRNLYEQVFFNQNKLFDFGFVVCPHFYKQSTLRYNLEILCYALHEYRKWLKGFDIIGLENEDKLSKFLKSFEISAKTNITKDDIELLKSQTVVNAFWYGKKNELLFFYDLLIGLTTPYTSHIKLLTKSFKDHHGEQIKLSSSNVTDYWDFKKAPSEFCLIIRNQFEKI